MESTTSPRPAVSVKISKDGIAWLQTTIEETSLGVFKIVSEEVIVRLGQHNGGVGLYCAWQVREGRAGRSGGGF